MIPSSRRKLGLALIIAPPACLFGSLILWTIFGFVYSMAIMSGGGGGSLLLGRVVNVIFGLLGIIGLLGLFTTLPIGLYVFFSTPKSMNPTQPPTAPPQV
jgi:hypothetical protein